jgi:hypothetical protein
MGLQDVRRHVLCLPVGQWLAESIISTAMERTVRWYEHLDKDFVNVIFGSHARERRWVVKVSLKRAN